MRLPLLLLAGCAPPGLADVELGLVPLVIVVTGAEDAEAAELRVEALILDRCGGTTVVLPVDEELDVLGPTDDEIAILPGGTCGLHLVLPGDGPALTLHGTTDGAPWTTEVALGAVSALEPFVVGDERVLFEIPLGEAAPGELGPIVARVWVDVDGDGALGPDDWPAGV